MKWSNASFKGITHAVIYDPLKSRKTRKICTLDFSKKVKNPNTICEFKNGILTIKSIRIK